MTVTYVVPPPPLVLRVDSFGSSVVISIKFSTFSYSSIPRKYIILSSVDFFCPFTVSQCLHKTLGEICYAVLLFPAWPRITMAQDPPIVPS